MFTVHRVCPSHGSGESEIFEIGTAETERGAIEALRSYMIEKNKAVLNLNAPDIVYEIALNNIHHLPNANITVRDDGVVFIDGNGSEMDYFTITTS